jgi:hypothetical protein
MSLPEPLPRNFLGANWTDHIEEAERLLQAAKDIAKRPKESEQDRKRDEIIVLDLLGFARVHAEIAQVLK